MAPSGRRQAKATSQGKTATTARRRMGEGCDVQLLLFETFGSCGKGVLHLLRLLGEEVQNRLSHAQSPVRPDVVVGAQLEDVPDAAAECGVAAGGSRGDRTGAGARSRKGD